VRWLDSVCREGGITLVARERELLASATGAGPANTADTEGAS
jgi:hypothetical protein